MSSGYLGWFVCKECGYRYEVYGSVYPYSEAARRYGSTYLCHITYDDGDKKTCPEGHVRPGSISEGIHAEEKGS